jgi:membrane associated rhomboid family serine protease
MSSILKDLKYAYNTGNIVTRFIFVNVAVFVALTLVRIFGFFYKSNFLGAVIPWIAGSSDPETMLFRPWTIITYMFVHEGFMHILFNMILLYFAGRLFADLLNEKRFIAVYFLGGIAGFLFYFAAYNIFPVFEGGKSLIYGASASVIAILVAIATYTPNMMLRLVLIGNVKLMYVAIFFVALDVLLLDGGNTGGRLAHLGGATFGYLYSTSLKRGNDWSKYFFAVTGFFRDLVKPKPKMKVASRNTGYRSAAGPQTTKKDKAHEAKIDAILDKISRSGYESLSKEEKEYLFNASKK